MKIVHIPNEVLITPTKSVTKFDSSLKKLIKEMEATLIAQTDPEGVGLAATQVGLNQSLFIMKPEPDSKTEVMINPKIMKVVDETKPTSVKTPVGKKTNSPMEGCLSIPKIWAPLQRAQKVLLQYQDVEGKTHEDWFTGFRAVIVQHETDHLNGILFTQRCLENNVPLYEEKGDELVKMSKI